MASAPALGRGGAGAILLDRGLDGDGLIQLYAHFRQHIVDNLAAGAGGVIHQFFRCKRFCRKMMITRQMLTISSVRRWMPQWSNAASLQRILI